MHNAFDNDCWIKTRVLNLSDARVVRLNVVVCFRSCLSGCWSVTVCMRRANRGYAWGMWDTLASVCCSQTCTSRPPSSSASFTKCCLLVSLMRTQYTQYTVKGIVPPHMTSLSSFIQTRMSCFLLGNIQYDYFEVRQTISRSHWLPLHFLSIQWEWRGADTVRLQTTSCSTEQSLRGLREDFHYDWTI